jgi:predicted DNA-binding transcriptional regulator AlpA
MASDEPARSNSVSAGVRELSVQDENDAGWGAAGVLGGGALDESRKVNLGALQDAVRTLAAALPPGAAVPVPREWLLRLLQNEGHQPSPQEVAPERLLKVDDAAARLGMSREWVYRNGRTLPFARRIGRSVRFSAPGIDRWLSQRAQR